MTEAASFSVPIRGPERTKIPLGDLVISLANQSLVIAYYCDDYYYSFEHPIHLGQLLSSLGLTAADCAEAIASWESAPTPFPS